MKLFILSSKTNLEPYKLGHIISSTPLFVKFTFYHAHSMLATSHSITIKGSTKGSCPVLLT